MAGFTSAFLGSYFSFNDPMPAIIFGSTLLILWFAVLFGEKRSGHTTLLFFGLFIVLVALETAVLRSPDGALIDAITTRYHYYSAAFVALVYLQLLARVPARVHYPLAALLLSGTVYWALANHPRAFARVQDFHARQLQAVSLSRFFNEIEIPNGHRPFIDNLLKEAKRKNVYHVSFPSNLTSDYIYENVDLPSKSAKVKLHFDKIDEDADLWGALGWALIEAREFHVPKKICVLAQKTGSDYNVMSCFPRWRRRELEQGHHANFGVSNGDFSGFQLVLPKKLLNETGSYRLGLMLQGKKNWHLGWTEHEINKPEEAPSVLQD